VVTIQKVIRVEYNAAGSTLNNLGAGHSAGTPVAWHNPWRLGSRVYKSSRSAHAAPPPHFILSGTHIHTTAVAATPVGGGGGGAAAILALKNSRLK
jgi:hypothetical protein